MKKILLILLFMSSAVFAENYTFRVENSTMVDVYFNIFNAMAAIFKNQEYLDLLRLAFLLGGFFVFATKAFTAWEGGGKSALSGYGKYLIAGFILLTLVFTQFKSTLWVTTDNIPSYCSDSTPIVGTAVELPTVLAYSFSGINILGNRMTEMAEMAFTEPSANGTTSMLDSGGYLGALKNSMKLLSVNANEITLSGKGESIDFNSLWQKHFNKCIYEVSNNKGAEGAKKISEMKSSNDLMKWTEDFLDYKFAGSTKATGDSLLTMNGVSLSCRNSFEFLKEANNIFASENECYFKDMNAGTLQLITGQAGMIQSSYDEIAIQSGIINALESSANLGSIGVNSGTSYATGKTKAEFIQSSLGTGAYMAEMLPFMQTTMRAVLYGFFPFVFVIVLLPGGLKVLVQYGQTMLWVELWGPTAAVINMFLNLKAENEMSTKYSEQGLNLMSSMNMLSEANTIAGMGAYLYASVPALTWLILKGSGHMLGSITGGVSAGFASNLKSQSVSKDMAMNEASKASGASITDTINSIEGSQVANKVADGAGFKSIGMNQTVQKKTTKNKAERLGEIEEITSHGGDEAYISNKVKKSGFDATAEKVDTLTKEAEGGKKVVADNQYIKTSTELQTTKKEITSAGGKENVVTTKSDMANKSFNKDLEVNKSTTVDNFKNLGKKEASDINATSDVVSKKGTKGLYDSKVQSMLTDIDTAKGKKAIAGSNENVAKTDSSMNTKEFAKKEVIDDTTSINDYKNLGKKDSTDINATSDVVRKEGTQGFYNSKVQNLTTESKTANLKKEEAGSNSNVSKTESKANLNEFVNKDEVVKNTSTQDHRNAGKLSSEDLKANNAKADLDGNGVVSSKEQKEYGNDMTTKSISDQNSLKFKNRRLLENAEKFAKSDNKDVRDTYNQAYNKFKAQGHEKASMAAAMAVQTSISTKEQSWNTDEKSEYVDRMTDSGYKGTDKARVQTQKDVEDINKTESEVESYARFAKTQNEGTENMKKTEETFFNKFKEEGMSDEDARLQAKNATLKSFAKESIANDEYTKDVLNHNVSDIKNDMNHKLEKQAYKEGVLTDDDFDLVKTEDALEAEKKALNSHRDDDGALNPYHAGKLFNVNRKLRNVREDLSMTRAKMTSWMNKDDDAKKIISEADKKTSNVVNNMKSMNLVKEESGKFKFAHSTMNVDVENMTEAQKADMRAMKGNLEGNYIKSIDVNGHNIERSYNLANQEVTKFDSSKRGYAMNSEYAYDKGYAWSEATNGKYDKETAIASSVVENVRSIAKDAGYGKFMAK